MIPKRIALLATLCLVISQFTTAQQSGIFQTYLTMDYNGSLEYFHGGANSDNQRSADAFDGQYLGTFSPSDNISIAGAEIHTWKTGTGDVTSAEFSYAIYKVGASSAFTAVNAPFCCNSGESNPCNTGETCTGAGGGDQRWAETGAGINILSGLSAGDYTIQVFFKAVTNEGDVFDSDSANGDYQATFTVGTDGFLDGDLSSGSAVWSGETTSFSILNPATDTSTGTNSYINGIGVTNNEVLVSNANTPDAVITTPSTQAYGTWQFSCATADGWNTSATNGFKVILMSDTDDPAKLKDGSFDFNGYMVEFGQNASNGNNDYFTLVRVEGSSKSTILSSLYPNLTNAELGYRLRITRDISGNWEMFIDEGFDGTAASTTRGTVTDNDITESSFFGFSTEITANAGRRAYYDNIVLNPTTALDFNITSSDNDETDGSLVVNVDIAHPSVLDATTAEVVLIKGDPLRIENYSTQTVTFPAGSTASIPLTIDISDNDDCDYNTSFLFALRNVTGGTDAIAGLDSLFLMNLNDDNTTSEGNRVDDFEDGDLAGWTGDVTEFTNLASTNLNGLQALHTDVSVPDGDVYLTLPSPYGDLQDGKTTWEFSYEIDGMDPNNLNRFMVFLTSSEADISSSTVDGYAVGINAFISETNQEVADRLKLYRIDDGIGTELINSDLNLGFVESSNAVRITRDDQGEWEFFLGETDFTKMVSVGTTTDTTHDFFGDCGIIVYKEDVLSNDWEVYLDDISIDQEFCSGAYESTGTGGTSSTNWQLVGNTTPATPPYTKYTELIVRTGDVMTLDSDIKAYHVTVDAGGELNLGADQELETYGNLTVDGTLNANKGAVTLIGNIGQQTVSGFATPTFYELNVDNTDGVLFNTGADFYGPIHPVRGTLDFNGQTVTLASDDVNGEILTGSISEIMADADVTGSITMERYLETATDGFRIIGLPITNQTVAALNDDFITTGFTGSDYPNYTFEGSIYVNLNSYDETAAGAAGDGYTPVTNVTDALDDEKAYIGYFPPETQNFTFDASGDFRKGDVTFNLTYTPDNGDPQDGWHMIPNPYPSAIDISSTAITYTNVQIAAYVLDNTLGDWQGQWRSWVDGTSNNGGSNILSSYQGYFAKATGPGASITFTEGCKVDDQAGYIKFDDASRQIMRFSINQGENSYQTTLSFHDQATEGFDSDFDGYFFGDAFSIGGYTLASKSGDEYYAINTLNELTDETEVTLRLALLEAGEYTLKLDDLQNISTSVCLFIEDTETGELYPINEDTEINVTAPEAEYITERFVLHARPGAQVESQMASCYGATDGEITLEAPAYSEWNIEWFDQNNNLVQTTSGNESVLSNLSAGTYTAVMTGDDALCNALTQEVSVIQPAQEDIAYTSYEATCSDENGLLNVFVSNANEWTVTAFENGQVAAEETGSELVSLNTLAGGVYTVQISTECTTEEFTIDVSDENAVQANFDSESEVIIENGIAPFQAFNTSANGVYAEWYLDGELISQSSDFSYEFLIPGEYELTLVSSNETCSSSEVRVITVSAADNVSELNSELEILNSENEWSLISEGILNTTVELYDATGKLVLSERAGDSLFTISKANLATGVYTLRITEDSKTLMTEKLVK